MAYSEEDYKALIPTPNKIQDKFMAWVEATAQVSSDSQACIDSFAASFNLDTAVGVQLDVLGELLGLDRRVNFNPGGGGSPILSDDFYRIALKAKILQNTWRGTKNEIYDFWQRFLPEYPVLIKDNQDMSMSVLILGMPNDLTGTYVFALGPTGGTSPEGATLSGLGEGYWEGYQAILRGLVTNGYFTPKPAGVSVDYAFSDDFIFTLGPETQYLKGLGTGHFVSFS